MRGMGRVIWLVASQSRARVVCYGGEDPGTGIGDQLDSVQRHSLGCFAISRSHANIGQLILVWSPGKGSVIHDHANAHCVMKVCSFILG